MAQWPSDDSSQPRCGCCRIHQLLVAPDVQLRHVPSRGTLRSQVARDFGARVSDERSYALRRCKCFCESIDDGAAWGQTSIDAETPQPGEHSLHTQPEKEAVRGGWGMGGRTPKDAQSDCRFGLVNICTATT